MFRIGEFSRISQTPISQLRYYDEIGLFEPDYIDATTGYRYYVAGQLSNLNRIMAMKELGLSLDQIKRLVGDDVSPDELRGMLSLKKAQVEQDLHAQVGLLRRIEGRLRQVERLGAMVADDVVVRALPPQPVFGFRETLPQLRAAVGVYQEITKMLPGKVGSKPIGLWTAVFHSDGFESENVDVQLGFGVDGDVKDDVQLSGGQNLTMSELPGVESAACIVRVGGIDKNFDCYATVGMWMEANEFTVAGPVREVFIESPFIERLEDNVAEIQVPVKMEQPPALVNAS